MLQRFYHCSAQSNVRSESARHLHEDIFTQQQHLCTYVTCLSSEVWGWSLQDSRRCLLASHSDVLKEQGYLGIWDSSRKVRLVKGRTQGATKSDAPIVDVGHFVLEVEINIEIDPKGDPVSRRCGNHTKKVDYEVSGNLQPETYLLKRKQRPITQYDELITVTLSSPNLPTTRTLPRAKADVVRPRLKLIINSDRITS
jgi:predicted component of type VI protein secretion system